MIVPEVEYAFTTLYFKPPRESAGEDEHLDLIPVLLDDRAPAFAQHIW